MNQNRSSSFSTDVLMDVMHELYKVFTMVYDPLEPHLYSI